MGFSLYERLALESETAPPPMEREKEICFYVKIEDFAQLKNAKGVEEQEQWMIKIPKSDKNAADGNLRIRKSTTKESTESKYVQTFKINAKDGSRLEFNTESNKESFLAMSYLADQGMIKDRFTFEGSKWELDVYKDSNGQYLNWCRLEYEFEEGESGELPEYPIQFVQIITHQNGQRTPEEEATVRTLFDTVFLARNKHI